MPMAREMGLGVTPWSPLKGGALTGKFTRENAGQSERGPWTNAFLNDKTYDLVDLLVTTAQKLESTPARVALSWVQNRPGVTSTIIGARRIEQLEDNLAALDLEIPDDLGAALDEATKPVLPFPHAFLAVSPAFLANGATINGRESGVFGISPESDDDRY